MLLSDLFETAALPLVKGQLPRVRGSYGAFIVTMKPEDFLALTTTDEAELKSIQSRPFPHDIERYTQDRYSGDKDFGRYELPFLKVHFPSGEIFGHEGRHRTNMVLQAGGKKIPVVIYPYEDNEYEVAVSFYDLTNDDGKTTESLGVFTSLPAAEAAGEARKTELEANEDMWSVKVKIEYLRGGTLKGAPARSEGWDRAAWRVEDFPHQLVGQYNPSIVVRDFRVGLVKGYRHFTR